MRILSLLTLSLGWAPPLWAKPAPQPVKAEALRYLQDLRTQNVKRLKDIDDTLRGRIEDAQAATIEFEVNRLKTAKREHALRQEFLDRLIFQVDTKFAGGDLRAFLERALTEMAKIDALSSAQTDQGLWKFMKFASDAVRRLPEKKENVLAFLEGYMNRSVANPIRPEDYLNTRNYSNGLNSESGQPLDRDEVGQVAEARLRGAETEEAKAPPPKAAPVELPAAVITTPTEEPKRLPPPPKPAVNTPATTPATPDPSAASQPPPAL